MTAGAVPTVALVLALSGCTGIMGLGGSGDGDGPGTRTDFVKLGPMGLEASTGLAQGVRLAGTDDPGAAVYRELRAAGADELPRARAALHRAPPKGQLRLAYVLPGCAETGARLVVTAGSVRAELTGGENTACGEAVFHLAVFDVPPEDLPEGTRLPGKPSGG